MLEIPAEKLPVLPEQDNACVGMMKGLLASISWLVLSINLLIKVDLFLLIEIISVVFGFLYILLIIRQNIWCWIFGILGSGLYILSCFHAKIYLEAFLNFYYVIIGFYGWWLWYKRNKSEKTDFLVTEYSFSFHLLNLVICSLLSLLLGSIMMRFTDSPRPYFDAVITVFGFSATILEARKLLSAWIYWFFINGASIVLMLDRHMPFYSLLSLVTTILSAKGYFDWRKSKLEWNRLKALKNDLNF